jgi:hypothetical protein
MTDTKTLIERAYVAFNKRDVDGALALMSLRRLWGRNASAPESQTGVLALPIDSYRE